MNRIRFPRLEFSRFLTAVAVLLSCSAPTLAGDVVGDVTEPDVISAGRLGRDVNAFYLGLSAGHASGRADEFGLRVNGGTTFGAGELKPSGNYAGLRGGWRGILPARGGRDYVYGLEVGYDFGTLDDSTTSRTGGTEVSGRSAISDVLSIRLRNGLTNRSGSVLYFVTVGYICGDITTSGSLSDASGTSRFESEDRRQGFSASLGAEHKLNDNWSITGEIEYLQFESKSVELGPNFTTKSTPSYRGLRIGLNYTF
ncbi:outer membrane immunogenic protein [Ruegeria halocynthiae]|uniref:Outer membrane immunogenic protein n=1 Tax=Ruegeria halocynthiae TaxID=985054 RepID=A0A1H2W3I4_9RHOB|nr:outer membrane immunogenic protein [Ruegeria halocynthiae]